MKFRDKEEICLFLIEVGKTDLLESVTDDFKPDQELVELLLKKRKPLISNLRDFRKSQNAKKSWRENRYGYMKGIKRFHSSTKGKRFHRELGNFLTRKIFDNRKSIFGETFDNSLLKSLSSLRTHAYVETEYYMPLYEYECFSFFIEDLLSGSMRLEEAFISGKEPDERDYDVVLRSIIPSYLVGGVSNLIDMEFNDLKEKFDEMVSKGIDSYTQIVKLLFDIAN